MIVAGETPKSPPGDYNSRCRRDRRGEREQPQGETPKSPPGDYNSTSTSMPYRSSNSTGETPKSPPGDYNPEHRLRPIHPLQRGEG